MYAHILKRKQNHFRCFIQYIGKIDAHYCTVYLKSTDQKYLRTFCLSFVTDCCGRGIAIIIMNEVNKRALKVLQHPGPKYRVHFISRLKGTVQRDF